MTTIVQKNLMEDTKNLRDVPIGTAKHVSTEYENWCPLLGGSAKRYVYLIKTDDGFRYHHIKVPTNVDLPEIYVHFSLLDKAI